MATDVFNNPSNDYVYPALSPCAGSGSDSNLEFIDDGIGIVSGSNILAYVDFGSIKIPVSAYSVETKIIGEREVIYIPGLSKGLALRQQGFTIPNIYSHDEDLNSLFFQIDFSINYYQGFSYTFSNIDVSSNYALNVNIEDALNIALGGLGIKVSSTYDPSILTFIGTLAGYDFNISNVVLTTIPSSDPSVFDDAVEYQLVEDVLAKIPAATYPNGGMQGIIMKGVYPTTTPSTPYDKWLYINHVPSSIQYYSQIEIDNYITNIRKEQTITYDPSITWGPFINNIDVNVKDISCFDTGYIYAPSYGLPITYNEPVDNSTLVNEFYGFSRITNSIIEYSGIFDFRLINPDTSVWYIADSSIYGSDLYDNNVGAITPESYAINCFISDSSLTQVDVSGGFIQKSYVRLSLIENADVVCLLSLEDSSIFSSTVQNFDTTDNDFYNSGIANMILTSSGIYDSSVLDSSIVSSTVSGSLVENCDVSLGYVVETYAKDTYFYNSIIIDSSILGGVIDSSSFVMNSVIENSYSNAYKLWVDSSNFIWVIDDPTLSIEDPSARVEIQLSLINDSSMNNVIIKDSSIYNSFIVDASLIRCTLYNVSWDVSTTYLEDCTTIQINMIQDCSVVWDEDSSTFYTREIKLVDVGRNGCSTSNIMSAGDYLQWITDNNYWNKFGDMYIWTTAPDGCSTCNNLLNGFYVYNPQPFDIKIEYMLFV